MRVAVVGGGINGVMSAWALARRGCTVDLFEKDQLMAATSSASSKMLHGGLRYLEHGRFGLVREALRERAWWISQAPHLARPLEILVPVYRDEGRPAWQLGLGIRLYELLAAGSGFPKGRWHAPEQVAKAFPGLRTEGLKGAFSYWDGQMDDGALGRWAATRAREAGVVIHEGAEVTRIDAAGGILETGSGRATYDRIVNAAGPWVDRLLSASAQASPYRLDLVRGSHLVIPGRLASGCVLQVPGEQRILFVLPHGEHTLLGTTEVRQAHPDSEGVAPAELDYLLGVYNRHFSGDLGTDAVLGTFSGVRPIVASRRDTSVASRESVIERQGRLINIFGGKWTTARALAEKVAAATLH
jgi:glycerol-3-phosphate dehydrogenase